MNALEILRAAQALLANHLTPQFEPVPAISRRTPGVPLPLSFCQEQIWLHAQLAPDIPAYNESFTIRRQGPLDISALEKSLSEIIRRHEAWRTEFKIENGQPVQVIRAPWNISLPLVDLRGVPAPEQESEISRLAGEEGRRPFNLSRGPLSRIKLVQLSDSEHRLLLTVHHIVCDSVSIYGVFLPELVALYEAFALGKSSPLPELSIQYADFAQWQREHWKLGKGAEQITYWRRQLSGEIPALQLPTDRPRPAIQSFRGDSQTFTISKSLTERLKAAGAREGTTLFATLFAVFAVLLHRYTQQDDMVIGSITTGRSRPELRGLLGYFLNPIVLRIDLSGKPTFREVLRRVHEVISASWANGQVPFELLVNELRPERQPGRNPFFQVMFSLEPTLPELPAGWDLTQLSVKNGGSKFDLYLETEERPEGLIGRFTYNSDLFEPGTIARMVEHFQVLIEGVAVNAELRLSELPILTAAEQKQLLVDWNDTAEDYPHDRCVHELIEAQAARAPAALAVTFEGQSLTYRQLNEQANQLAGYLRKLGVGPDVLVGICIERSLEMLVGLLGILKAGGAYVPLDPAYPPERLAFMLDDARVSVLLTQSALSPRLPQSAARIVEMDTDWVEIAREGTDNPENAATAENLAYVIYTSGSTGRPKGVMIAHRSLVNYLMWSVQEYAASEGGGALVHSPLSFDLTITSLFSPLLVGQRVILLPESPGVEELGKALLGGGDISLVKLTPAHLRLLNEWLPATETNRLAQIRCVVIGGEALYGEDLAVWRRDAPLTRLINEYGPTETVVGCCIYEVGSAELSGAIPIGRPISNTQLYVLDDDLQPVPIGVSGQLYIGGDGLARGYWNRPELTAESFIPHPLSKVPGARLYKSGDRVRYRPDGNIEFLGRFDDQVKIRGYRIELGEIESALAQHPQISDVAAVVCEDTSSGKNLVAFVVADREKSIAPEDLRGLLKQRLPAYMLPSRFVFVDVLPLTPNGKVDRTSLSLTRPPKSKEGASYAKARSPLEARIVQIWEELLEVHPIGVQDNFFDLGGHSLLGARLLARIEQEFGKKLSFSALFQAPTVETMAAIVGDESFVAPASRLLRIQPLGSKPPLFWVGAGPFVRPLSRHLKTDQPFVGLIFKPSDVAELSRPYDVRKIAQEFVAAAREAQPEGPYFLGGHCLSGVIAYEAAKQLLGQGQQVALLVLVEADNPTVDPIPPKRSRSSDLAARLRVYLSRMRQMKLRERLGYIFDRLNRVVRPTKRRPSKASSETGPPAVRSQVDYIEDILRILGSAVDSYEAGQYPGPVVSFRCSEPDLPPDQPSQYDWSAIVTGSFEVHEVPGDHIAMMSEPNVEMLGKILTACLLEAYEATIGPATRGPAEKVRRRPKAL